jgi:RNA polymerase sigma-70 factor (ECF subfamily)
MPSRVGGELMSSGAITSGPGGAELRWRGHLEKIRGRDSSALQSLYDDTSRLLYSLAFRVLNDREDAEEVILDVYQQVWNAADRYDPARGNVLSWLAIMTRNRAIDRVRQSNVRRTREIQVEEPPDAACESPAPEQQTILEQQRAIVRRAIQSLAPDQREAIELAFYSGLSHSEVADTLGAPLGTVKTRIRVGMQKLRKALPTDLWVGRG